MGPKKRGVESMNVESGEISSPREDASAHSVLEPIRIYEFPEIQSMYKSLKSIEVEVWHEGGGKKWVKGRISQTSAQRVVFVSEADKKEIAFSFKSDKAVKLKLREFVKIVYSGRKFMYSSEQQTMATMSSSSVSVELIFRDVLCKSVDHNTMYSRFIKERKPELTKEYARTYKTPVTELQKHKHFQEELVTLQKKYEDLITRNDAQLNAALAAELLALDAEAAETLGSRERELVERKLELQAEYNLRTQQAESGVMGASARLALKVVDEWHRGEYAKRIRLLEKEVHDGQSSFSRRRKQAERKVGQERQALLTERDETLENIKRHIQALELHWKWEEAHEMELITRSIEYRANAEWAALCKADPRLAKALDECEKCHQDPGIIVLHTEQYPELKGSDFRDILLCDECMRFSMLFNKIQELNLKPTWCKSSYLTAYGLYVQEQTKSGESDNLKAKFQSLDDHNRGLWERRRQHVLLELLMHIKEAPTVLSSEMAAAAAASDARHASASLCFDCLKEPAVSASLVSVCSRLACGWQLCEECAAARGRPAAAEFFCSLVCQKEAEKLRLLAESAAESSQQHQASLSASSSFRVVAPAGRGSHRQSPDAVHLARLRRTTFLLQNWSLLSEFLVDGSDRQQEVVLKKRQDAAMTLVNHGFQKEFLGRLVQYGVSVPQVSTTPSFITGSLRDYQLTGVNWLLGNWARGSNSCLADEMGAGKSFQVAAFLALLKANVATSSGGDAGEVALSEVLAASNSRTFTHLIVCPLSVLPNWLTEIRRFTPTLHVMALYGPLNERDRQKAQVQALRAAGAAGTGAGLDVLVTTYETLVQEQNWLGSGGAGSHFECLILDEAQRIKSHESLVAKAVRNIKCSFKLLLTGTPIQNNLTELWSLLNFLYPEVFTDTNIAQFTAAFSIADNVRDAAFAEKAHRLLNLVMLRRLKAEVLKNLLPPKTEIVLGVPLSDLQRRYYREFLLRDRGMVGELDLPGVTATRSVSFLLMQLWKCCLHPYLFGTGAADGAGEVVSVDGGIVYDSGKMVFLDLILSTLIQPGNKVLIYSQFTTVLDLIQEYCMWRGRKALRLDGSTSLARRRFYMFLFNRREEGEGGYDIFLVSTKAGGVGINLQAANTVVMFDSSFNPFQDFQAMDRSHRVGQEKPVSVYRLLTRGTCEERIRHFAEQKVLLKDAVLKDATEDLVLEDEGETPGTSEEGGVATTEVYEEEQVREMVDFNAEEFLSAGKMATRTEDEFYDQCDKSLRQQLANAKQVVRGEAPPGQAAQMAASPRKRPARNIDLRALKVEGRRTSEVEEEAEVVEATESSGRVRMREKTTVVVEDAELGRVEVDRWSVEQARHEEELAKRAKQAAAAAAGSGRKIGHEDNCAHCKEDLRIQTAVVSTEVDASSGRVVKRRRIASAIPNFLCPGCPVALHGRCAAVVGCVAGTLGGRPNCPGHRCRLCDRSGSMAGGLLFRCVDCITGTVCFDCAERLGILDDVEYLENHGRWESNFNYFPPGTYEYIRCAECRQRRKQ